MDKTLCLDANLEGARAMLHMNGMVLGMVGDGLPLRRSVHEYLCRGENRVQLALLDGDPWSRPCTFRVDICLHKDRGGNTLVQSDLVYSIENTVTPRQTLYRGRLVDVRVDLPIQFPAWHFLSLLRTPSSTSDPARLRRYCNQMLSWIEDKDLDALLPQFSARNRELALAYGLDAQLSAQQFGSTWSTWIEEYVLSPATADADQWCFDSIQGSCVYHVRLKDHSSFLQFSSTRHDERVDVPLHLAVINSDVFVVR